MSTYIHFTGQQKEQARQTDLAALLQSQGEELKRSGSEYEWKDGSAKVTIRGNLWYHQYDQEGGDAISFVRRFYDKDYPQALEFLLGGKVGMLVTSPPIEKKKETEKFELPKRNDTLNRVYAYLLIRRGINKSVLNAFVGEKMIYESAEYHNAVFVGYDQAGQPWHANLRGTGKKSMFKGNAPSSNPEYSFHWHGKSDSLYLFEAPIDMLSYISMHKCNWREHSYAACCGVGERVLFRMLKDNPNLKKVYLCLDNDEAGQTANRRIQAKLYAQGIPSEVLVPQRKDWNEDLLYMQGVETKIEPEKSEGLNGEEREEEKCRELQLS